MLNLEQIMMESGIPGLKPQPAKLLRCACGSDQFTLFQLDTQDHYHIQCYACGISYCPAGACMKLEDVPMTREPW